jgi:dimethylamine/trimethylamine dehydrogenase
MDARLPTSGPLLVYDDDQAYLAGVLAEHLAGIGLELVFVTPASVVSPFTEFTLEQARVQRSLLERGVTIITGHKLVAAANGSCETRCVYTDKLRHLACATLLSVTERVRHCDLFEELRNNTASGLQTLELIGDAAMPGLIADAVYAGHMAARNFEADPGEAEQQLFRREIVALENAGDLT